MVHEENSGCFVTESFRGLWLLSPEFLGLESGEGGEGGSKADTEGPREVMGAI